jgi:nucleotide-binding universal stress UspA family protein
MKTTMTSKPSFHNVLVATDLTIASGAALRVARNICGDLGEKLTVLHVVENGSVSPETGDASSSVELM